MKRIDIAILTFTLAAGRRVQLLPAGPVFRARDGRPEKLPGYRIDAKIAAALIARAAERQTPLVVDYEHQTLFAEKNGQPAPAAGWFRTLEWVEGEGLFATDMEWTARALEMIAAGEYKFISPVFSYDTRTGAVLEIQMAAITNNPALDGMAAVAAHRFLSPDQPAEEIRIMNELLKKLLAGLGLQETATEAEATAALTALKASADKAASLEREVVALKAASPDPEKFAPVAAMKALQSEVAALTAKLNGQELDAVIAEALTAGKLLPAQESWARELGGKDLASLKGYLATAPAVMPVGTQSGGKGPGAGGDGKLNDAELAVCRQLGITAEEFLKSRAGEAAAA